MRSFSVAVLLAVSAGPLFADVYKCVNPNGDVLFIFLIGWALIGIASLVVWLAMRSPWGRVIKGIREDEDAVRSLGKNVYSYKMQSLVLGGVLGCLGGFVFALANASVSGNKHFSNENIFTPITSAIRALVIKKPPRNKNKRVGLCLTIVWIIQIKYYKQG